MGDSGLKVIMCWTPGREQSSWEKRCIDRAKELFTITWLNLNDYDIPQHQYQYPQGPSEWARWSELRVPFTLWSDCDVYWYRVPDRLDDCFLCDKMRGGFRPNDAVVWSGDGSVGTTVFAELQKCSKFVWTHRLLKYAIRYDRHSSRGKLWDFFGEDMYNHKGRG